MNMKRYKLVMPKRLTRVTFINTYKILMKIEGLPAFLRHFPKLLKAQNIHHCEYTHSRLRASDTAQRFVSMTTIKLNILNEILFLR